MFFARTIRLVGICALLGIAGCVSRPLITRAERTDYRETSRYDETVAYCRAVAAQSGWVRVLSIGTTPEGRDIPLVVLSKERAFTPAAVARTGKAVLLIVNGVHAGEIEGKDASLALMREIAVTHSLEQLLDHVILLVVPIFNIDGHERFGPHNRINQNGPAEMGWRCTAQNLNLNRDYMKADAPEMRALLHEFHSWRPHLWFDTHTTDGADFQYDVTFGAAFGAENSPDVARFVSEVLHPHLLKDLAARGHVPQLFFDLRDRLAPAKGIETNFGFAPRFSTGYGAVTNRPSILVETHMLKPHGVRVKATYDLLVSTLELVNSNPAVLIGAVRKADEETGQLAVHGEKVVLTTTRPADDPGEPITFKGYEVKMVESVASGSTHPVWNQGRPIDIASKLFSRTIADRAVTLPKAYIIPPGWSAVVERLRIHHLPMRRLTGDATLSVESYRLSDPHWHEKPFEGRHVVTCQSRVVAERRTFPAGSVVVTLDNPMAKLAAHLLEPGAPDSLLQWGFFDAVFEQKEYFEDYAMAPIADRMLERDASLRSEFEAWTKANPEAAKNPRARLDFFFRHSPYWDDRKDLYPVARVMESVDRLPAAKLD